MFLCSLWVSCCAVAPSAASGPVCAWVAFISTVLALPCLHAICPCGPQQSKTQTDSLTQPRGQGVTILWIQFSRFPRPLHGPSTDQAGQLMLQINSWTQSSLGSSIDILANFICAFVDFVPFTVKVMFQAWRAKGTVLSEFLKKSFPSQASPKITAAGLNVTKTQASRVSSASWECWWNYSTSCFFLPFMEAAITITRLLQLPLIILWFSVCRESISCSHISSIQSLTTKFKRSPSPPKKTASQLK